MITITRWANWGAVASAVALMSAPSLPAGRQRADAQAVISDGGIQAGDPVAGGKAAGPEVANLLGFDSPNLDINKRPSPDSAKIGMAAAPALIQAAQLPCTLSEARYMFEATGADKGKAKVYEVACHEGLGYVIVAPQKAGAAPVIFDCMATTQPVDGKPNPMACKLVGNADPAKGLNILMARSGRTCAVEKGRYLGSTEDRNVYEVACHEGGGYILQAAKAPGDPTTANTCLAYACRLQPRWCILGRRPSSSGTRSPA